MKEILFTLSLIGVSVLYGYAQASAPQQHSKLPFMPMYSPGYSSNMPMDHMGSLQYDPETGRVSTYSDPKTGLFYDFNKREIRQINSGNPYRILLEPREKVKKPEGQEINI